MKNLFVSLLTLLAVSSFVQASDFGDKNCNIFVSSAENVVTGGNGNFLSASIVISKDLISRHFQNYQVQILGSESVKPTKIEDKGQFMVFTFDMYAKGVEYRGNSARVVAFITNGVDRLFDNNDNVLLVSEHNWQYTNQRCK